MQFNVYECFVPECNLDTLLIEVLLECPNKANHAKGNSSVVRKVDWLMEKNGFGVGVIDKDKRELPVLSEFKEESISRKDLKLFRHRSKGQIIIQICPAIESWIWNQCREAGINLADYRLPDSLKGLVKSKSRFQRNDERFRKLFRDMLQNEKCQLIRNLDSWVNILKEKNRNFDINDIINV